MEWLLRRTFMFAALVLPAGLSANTERVQLSDYDVRDKYTTENFARTSVHDPSVVYDQQSGRYYIFGSHMATAYSANLQDWTLVNMSWGTVDGNTDQVTGGVLPADAFVNNRITSIRIGGVDRAFGDYDAAAWICALGDGDDSDGSLTDWTVDGNMWAPDVVYNPIMGKWCQYLSLNGPKWNSCIVLLTADKLEGPYVYEGPVVFTGFRNNTDERISYKKTDLELVLGSQDVLPERYNKGEGWGSFWPHAIDPCVFYDEEGNLLMAYGSWSGGIFMLELDEQTGLRDYDVKYESDYDALQGNLTSDAYFGKKIAGGFYVSGEGPYIEYIDGYYYLFMSYGGFAPDGGYEMRIFRSENPDGPYVDLNGIDARFNRYVLNYGLNSDTRGEKLMGYYNNWGFMTVGECSQGHNSVIAAPDGNTYLVYHTKFNDGTAGHQVRVHQLYKNRNGWLVAAPFEYQGETAGDADIANGTAFTGEVAGDYKILTHPYGMDHRNFQESQPVKVTLHEDGSVSGAYSGTWEQVDGTDFFTLKIGNDTYEGVLVEQSMEPTTIKALCFTACNGRGVNVWGYKMLPDYAVAYVVNNLALPFRDGQTVNKHLSLYDMKLPEDVTVEWTSDKPEIISHTGIYNPSGLEEDTDVNLTLTISSGQFYWTKTYQVVAKMESVPAGDYLTGLKAYYGFDETPFVNAYNVEEEASPSHFGTGLVPVMEVDRSRPGSVLHQYFGISGNNSYTRMHNALEGDAGNGVTISMWVKRSDDVAYDALWSFYDESAGKRLYFTGNAYIGYNDGTNWLDIDHPSKSADIHIPVGEWSHIVVTVSNSAISTYIDGTKQRSQIYEGACDGGTVSSSSGFDYQLMIDFINRCPDFYLGHGSFWGSVDVKIDDVMLYNRVLSSADIRALNTMGNRVTDFTVGEGGTGIEETFVGDFPVSDGMIYDLSGRRVNTPVAPGVYIRNGKKYVVNGR